jgi:competence protein ComEC
MFFWRKYPYLRVSLLFIAGIILADSFNPDRLWLAGLTGIAFLLWILLEINKKVSANSGIYASLAVMLFFLLAGMLRYQINDPRIFEYHIAQTGLSDTLVMLGVIQELPKQGNRLRSFLTLNSIQNKSGKFEKIDGEILIYFDKDDSFASLYKPGDLIAFRSVLSEPFVSANPKAFDYAKYLKYRKVFYQTHIAKEQHEILEFGQFFFFKRWALDLRIYFLSVLEKHIESKDHFAVASALVLGHRDFLDQDLYQAFSDAGAVHVLAVSGLHVGIVCGILMFFFDRIKRQDKWIKALKMISIITLVFFFAFMTGAAPAVTRAAVMFSIFIIGRYWFDSVDFYNILSFTALILLCYDPYLLFQASFQFSFLALTGLVFFQPHISSMLSFQNPILSRAWELISVSISAQTLIFPVCIFFFNKFPLYFMLSGLIAVPMAMISLVLGLLVLVTEPIMPFMNYFFAYILRITLDLFTSSVIWIKSLPYSSLEGLRLNLAEATLLYVMVFAMMYLVHSRSKKWLLSGTLALLLFSVSLFGRELQSVSQLKIFVYDSFKGSVMDIVDGKNAVSLLADKLDESELTYINKNNILHHDITYQELKNFSDHFQLKRVAKRDNILQLANYNIGIPTEKQLSQNIKKHCQIIMLLNGSGTYSPREILPDLKMVIADKSIKTRSLGYWKTYCEENDIDFFSVKDDGAIEIVWLNENELKIHTHKNNEKRKFLLY